MMKKQVKRYLGPIVLGIALATVGVAGQAQAIQFTQTNGSLAASAEFDFTGGVLNVTLTNSSQADVLVPSQVLTAVFFSSDGGLAPLSAVLNGPSTVHFDADGQPAGGIVGGEWAYGSGLVGAPLGATQGISSAGFGLFGQANFPGPNLAGQTAVGGLNYGLTSLGDNTGTGNAGVTGNVPLIKSSVTFTLAHAGLGSISNVSFVYGTELPPATVPEPASALLLGGGLVAVGVWRRFRKAA